MPYARSDDGVRIHYEVNGDGPPLVLQHGFTQSIEDWIECGHGASDADPVFAQAQAAAAAIPGARFIALPKLQHLPAFTLADEVIPSIVAFQASTRAGRA